MPCEEYLHLVSLKASIHFGYTMILVVVALGVFVLALRKLKTDSSLSASHRENFAVTAVGAK